MFQRPKGTRDFSPDEMAYRRWALEAMRKAAIGSGFREIQMPTFEDLELFTTKSGPGVVDELYAFKDKGGRDVALRPEMTAQVMRYYVSDLATQPKPLKLFYFGPCFRYENPQSGRYREFFQFGAEIIGAGTPETDAEALALASRILRAIGLKDFKIRVGYIGVLRGMLKELKFSDADVARGLHYLDKNDVEEFTKCALRNLVPKKTIDHIIDLRNTKGGTDVIEKLGDENAKVYLKELVLSAESLGVKKPEIDLGIVRGLDYYAGMVFEIDANSLGAEKQICGGGSYDLVPLFGGEQVFTTGFALGFDRCLLALSNEGKKHVPEPVDFYIIPVGEKALKECLGLAASLRDKGFSVDFDLMRRSLSKNMKYAGAIKAKNAVIIGDKELEKGAIIVRDMESGEQKEIKKDSLIEST